MSTGVIIALVVAAIVVILVISLVAWYISTKNSFIRMEEDINSSESRIDVFLTKRFDDLTKMIATVKGYSKHEFETLSKITEMRAPSKNASIKEKSEFNNQLSDLSKNLNIVLENYPDLKANTNFLRLQDEIAEIEDDLQAARSNYNSNVSTYNKAIRVFPGSIVAGSKFTTKEYFEAEESKRKDVEINF